MLLRRGHSRPIRMILGVLIGIAVVAGCRTLEHAPMKPVEHVELSRFMGDWYVIANIPTRIERGAHNAVESYRLAPDGRVLTRFTFRAGSFDGPEKLHEPVGFIKDTTSNAVWGMRFIWPVKADYRIVYVDPDYTTTIVARQARDYAWIMARKPTIAQAEYERLTGMLSGLGYDASKFQRVPQRWP